MDESPQEIANAVAAVGRIEAVPTLLQVLCETTGMRFAVVARVTDTTWTACAVFDALRLGIEAGSQLAAAEALNLESHPACASIVIEHASVDARYRGHPLRQHYQIESFVSVPIILPDGRHFGTLCALDPRPAAVSQPHVLSMFSRFAALIAAQLDSQSLREREHAALLDERATSELREQFIAILGHDLRNPLQAVSAGADLLARRLSDPAHVELALRIKANARRMSLLIDDVLDFARARLGGGIGVDFADVENINVGLSAVVHELQTAQPDCQILADIRVTRPVRCDLGRLQQLASNLLANALTHGRRHCPVMLTARALEDDFVLEVWNAGAPIPAESIDKIFEPFWRHSVSASRNGLGLGLHICAEIVRAHGGRISVASTIETGTQFTAWLPLSAQSHKPGDAQAPAPLASAVQRTDGVARMSSRR